MKASSGMKLSSAPGAGRLAKGGSTGGAGWRGRVCMRPGMGGVGRSGLAN